MPPRPHYQPPLSWLSRPSTQHTLTHIPCPYRAFSSTPSLSLRRNKRMSKARRAMFTWLEGPGRQLKYARPGSTNYLGAYDKSGAYIGGGDRGENSRNDDEEEEFDDDVDPDEVDEEYEGEGEGEEGEDGGKRGPQKETRQQLRPFPLNRFFVSEAVLSEELRQEIYKRVVERNQSVREVSIQLGVEMARVGAVVRLMTIEQDWIRQGKPLALPYQSAVLSMVPTTPYNPTATIPTRHESINDLPVHPATLPQIFHPTSESRHFTRADAGRIFHPTLLPADARIPHPEMIAAVRDRASGMNPKEVRMAQAARIAEMARSRAEAVKQKEERERKATTVVAGRRWDFKFVECAVEAAGGKGRGAAAVGRRYGFPNEDRKKGQVKIVTKVE